MQVRELAQRKEHEVRLT